MTDTPRQFRDLGIPVRAVSWARLLAGRNRDGAPCVYAAMGQQADNLFVLQIDPRTGVVRQFVSSVPGSNYPTHAFMSRSGRLYVGAAYAGHLLCLDPGKDAFEDLGAIHPGAAVFPCRLDEDAEGRIWIGSYGTADLTCYDPRTGQFTPYGRMDDVDMYNYPLVNTDGTVACLIRMTRPHVVVLNPATGEKAVVGPMTTKGEDTIDMRRGVDGGLYIESSLGDCRIDGVSAVPVDAVPAAAPEPDLADGTAFAFADADQSLFRTLRLQTHDGRTCLQRLDYEASGTDIFCLHGGPDGRVYGSSILPLHLFRYDPQNGELADLGKCSSATGEAYSMATLDGKIAISSYGGAVVSVYDPSRPYRYGTDPDANPRDLGRIDDISCRPRSTLAGPLGRIWLASIPDYGMWGGPLSYYDPHTGEKHAYYRIAGDASCYMLAHLPERGLIAVGTHVAGGSGTQPKVGQAVLFLWDYAAEKKVWEGTLPRPITHFSALLTGPNGNVYGTAQHGNDDPELFVFDPDAKRFVKRVPVPGIALDHGLQHGPGGNIYGFTTSGIYRFDPADLTVEEIVRQQDAITGAGPIVGRTAYVGTGHHLRAFDL